jgi:hypothetical protein
MPFVVRRKVMFSLAGGRDDSWAYFDDGCAILADTAAVRAFGCLLQVLLHNLRELIR